MYMGFHPLVDRCGYAATLTRFNSFHGPAFQSFLNVLECSQPLEQLLTFDLLLHYSNAVSYRSNNSTPPEDAAYSQNEQSQAALHLNEVGQDDLR